jgi:hypothetical protein
MIIKLSYLLIAIIMASVSPALAGDMLISAQVDAVSTSGTVSTVSAKVSITNDTGGAISNVVGNASAMGDGVAVTSGTVTFNSVASGASASSINDVTVTIDSSVAPSSNVGLPIAITYQDAEGIPQMKNSVVMITLE